jgi:hypothetical protein
MYRLLLLVCGSLLLCVAAVAQGKNEAKKIAGVLGGDAKQSAAANPQCKLFTPAEVSKYVGEPLAAGQNAAMGSACEWGSVNKDAEGQVIVAVVPAGYHEPPRRAKGYRALPDVGMKGFVAPELGGWVAGCIEGADAIRVTVSGMKASESTAIELLKETVKRRTK